MLRRGLIDDRVGVVFRVVERRGFCCLETAICHRAFDGRGRNSSAATGGGRGRVVWRTFGRIIASGLGRSCGAESLGAFHCASRASSGRDRHVWCG